MSLLARAVARLPRGWIARLSSLQFRSPRLGKVIRRFADALRGRDGVIQRGVGKGLRFNTTANIGYLLGTSEPDVQMALSLLLRPNMVFYDVGASIGFTAVLGARLVGSQGTVVCFEPLEANVRQLLHNVSLNRFSHVVARCEALSDRQGPVRFAVSEIPTLGRMTDAADGRTPDRFERFLEVPARRLDDVVADSGLPPPHVIKMDVEGAEVQVIAGGAATLRTARPVLVIELHGTNRAVHAALSSLGYRLHVLGSPEGVTDAHWNSHVVALPRERSDASDLARVLTAPDLASKVG